MLDTGAQVSILSRATAFALGLDKNGDGSFDDDKIDELPLGGIGGEINMPLLPTDSWAVHTTEGVDLRWKDATVGVIDIDPMISGVLGMDFLTSGWLAYLFGGGGPTGYIDQFHLDYRDAANYKGGASSRYQSCTRSRPYTAADHYVH